MATLSLNKTYADATGLFETDLDNIRSGIITFLNTTKVNDDNINTVGIVSANIADGSITTDRMTDLSATGTQLKLEDYYAPIGTIQMFHTFNGTVSVPYGWMICNGDVVNSTNYNAIHGAGQYTVDGISGSDFDGLTLPDMADKYAVGVASTTTISTVGNTNHTVSMGHTHTVSAHTHFLLNYNGTSADATTWTLGGSTTQVLGTSPNDTDEGLQVTGTGSELGLSTDAYTSSETGSLDTSSVTSADAQPDSIEVLFIIKVI